MKNKLFLVLCMFLLVLAPMVSAEKMWNFNNHTVNISDDLYVGGDIYGDGSGLSGVSNWNVSGTNLFPGSLDYDVGIGTDSPIGALHVKEPSGGGSGIIIADTTDAAYSMFKMYREGYEKWAMYVDNSDKLNFRSAGSDIRMTIDDANGNVGIGTTSPGAKLEVAGGNLRVDSDGVAVDYMEFNDRQIQVNRVGSSSGMEIETLGSYEGEGGYIDFNPKNVRAMRITSAGNVGIGTTSPGSSLDVNGDIELSEAATEQKQIIFSDAGINRWLIRELANENDLSFYSFGTASEVLHLDYTGNVGIGTDSPTGKLHVIGAAESFPATSGTTQTGLITRLQTSTSTGILDIGSNAGSGSWIQSTNIGNLAANYALLLNPNGGNVGIGTTTPQNTLNVIGDGNFTGTIYQAGSSLDDTYLRSDGDNGTGEYNFGGSWADGGVTINDGGVYAQTVYVYNITSLGVTDLKINGSLMPQDGFDNIFDVGSPSLRWNDGFFGGDLNVNGTISAGGQSMVGGSGVANRAAFWTDADSLSYDGNFTWDNTNKRLGIGEASPAHKLHVQDLTDPMITIEREGAWQWGVGVGGSGNNGESSYFVIEDTSGGADIPFTIAHTTGYVGIGVTDPDEKLEVNGNVNINGGSNRLFFSGYRALEGVNDGSKLDIGEGFTKTQLKSGTTYTTGDFGIGTTTPDSALEVFEGNIKIGDSSNTGYGTLYERNGNTIGIVNTANNVLNVQAQSNTRVDIRNTAGIGLTVADSGYVGVGDTTPSAKFHVNTTDNTVARFESSDNNMNFVLADDDKEWVQGIDGTHFYIGEATDDRHLTIMDSGNVGIGTSSPGTTLEVLPSSAGEGITVRESDDGNDAINLEGNAGNGNIVVRAAGSATSIIRGNGITYFNGGNVGIGTTSPISSLDVTGNFTVDGSVGDTDMDGYRIRMDRNEANYISATDAAGYFIFETGGGSNAMKLMADQRALFYGDVGIGTTSPQNTLNVIGDINATTNIYSGGFVNATTDVCIEGGTCLGSIDAGSLGAVTGSGTAMRVPLWNGSTSLNNSNIYQGAGGNVGVGTDSPTGKLHLVTDTVTPSLKISQDETSSAAIYATTQRYGIFLQGDSTSQSHYLLNLKSNSGSTNVLYAGSDGNVGIGTSSPGYELDVNGSIGIAYQDSLNFRSATGTAYKSINVDDGVSGYYTLRYISNGGDSDSNVMHQWLTNKGGSSNTEVMSLTRGGDLGVGTTTPSQKLEVNGSALIGVGTLENPQSWSKMLQVQGTTGAGLSVKDDNNEFNLATYSGKFFVSDGVEKRLTIDSSGNVGIGTTSPDALLDLKVDNANFIHLDRTAREGVDTVFRIGVDSTDVMTLGRNGHIDMVVDNTGNVGIGTTSPGAKLHVAEGDLIITRDDTDPHLKLTDPDSIVNGLEGLDLWYDFSEGDIYFDSRYDDVAGNIIFRTRVDGTPINAMTILGSGDVGIGTTAPTKTLEVQGEINVTTTDADISMFMEGGMLVVSG